MAKYSKFRKTLISSLCAVTLACTGLAAACGGSNDDTKDKDENPFEKREDIQTLKNGDFEYYDYPSEKQLSEGKAEYLIKTPDNWTRSGDSTGTLGGIIGTSHSEWAALTASDLSQKLKDNADRKTDDDDYVNYNGMRARDLLYKDTYAALLDSSSVSSSYIKNQTFADYFGIEREGNETDGFTFKMGDTKVVIAESASADDKKSDTAWKSYEFFFEDGTPVRQQLVENPGTHYDIQYNESTGTSTAMINGVQTTLKTDKATGSLYYTTDDGDVFVSNVLMLHNYDNDISSTGTTNSSKFNGIHQYYTSSQSITLEANTAAEISVWVKTSDLKFDKGYSQLRDHDRGAYIEVVQTVGGTTIDSMKIESINTEKLIAESKDTIDSNGWIKYTVYVNSCDFAASTIQLRLGLGDSDSYKKLTGYAFFDDVQVTKYQTLEDEGCTYGDNSANIPTCTLTSEEEDRIFVADRNLSGSNEDRYYENFHYLIDLASETAGGNHYDSVTLGSNVTASLTEYKNAGKYYVSAESYEGAKNIDLTPNTAGATLPKNTEARVTKNDLIGLYNYNKTFAKSDFSNTDYANFKDYSDLLNKNLTAEDARLPEYTGNFLLMLSSRGAAYTSKITSDSFSLASGEYMIVSFWVKTSDISATVKLTTDDPDKSSSLSINTTGKTTDFGDDEDIYNGWVKCFVFVENDSDEAEPQKFNLEFIFGNTTIAADTAYAGGWIALADVQVLSFDNDVVYNLAPSGDNVMNFSFTKEAEKDDGNAFDTVSGTSDIKNGLANLANYNGYNGGSSAVSNNTYLPSYDAKNAYNELAGLINRKHFDKYDTELQNRILSAFGATTNWDLAFGSDCYQPLIIINNLRTYTEKADATEDTYSLYYIEAEEGYTGSDLLIVEGKKYKKATEWDENATYYSFAANYGFAGNIQTISADTCQTVTVRVKVSGQDAEAWVYLVGEDREVLRYTTSEYTFWYDADGNVLDEKYDSDWVKGSRTHRDHIVYTRRDDGLYEDKDGKVYYNLHNLIKKYDNYLFDIDNSYKFFDKDGNQLNVDDLKDNGDYVDEKGNPAPHFLANTEGRRIFEFKDGKYYFIDAEGKVTDTVVENFKDEYKRNYQSIDKEYAVRVTAQDCANANDGWVTVNFVINTGSLARNYRLELWSGERGESGVSVDANGNGTYKAGAVAFDYCSYSVTSSNYSDLVAEYEGEIINEYKQLLIKHNKFGEIASNDENLTYYEELLKKLVADSASGITQAEVDAITAKYTAVYHAYSYYDSTDYAPLTAKEAENYTYDATSDDYAEAMAFMTYNTEDTVNIFANYSVVDKSITPTVSDDDTTDETPDDGEEKDNGGANVWLYAASILLLVALLITLISIIARKVYKKLRPKVNERKRSKNNYRQRERYIRKLHLVREETVDEPVTPAEPATPVEPETPAEETPAEPEETTVEEAPVEETPAATEEPEAKAEEPAEEAPKSDDEPKE